MGWSASACSAPSNSGSAARTRVSSCACWGCRPQHPASRARKGPFMRAKGINYDTGFINKGTSSRESFDLAVVRRELRIIRDDLHCTAVRVTGGDVERLDSAARLAAEAGLEVWFSPFTCDLTEEEMLDLLTDCAERG